MEGLRVEPKNNTIVSPPSYYKIGFECSNRSFYGVKNDLYDLADSLDIEIEDGYIDERCDYEGDLEEIIVYNGDREGKFLGKVLELYGVDPVFISKNMNLHLSVF